MVVGTLEIPAVVKEITTAIDAGKRFLMVPHQHIDGDDLGCMISLALALKEKGKEVYLYSDNPVPQRYKFLEGHELISDILPEGKFDAVFILECPNYNRLPKGIVPKNFTKTIITLDHHCDNPKENRFIGNINWVDPSMSALGEMIALLILDMKLVITSAIATALYTSIVSDSNAFRYKNVSPRTHIIVAKLLASAPIDTNNVHFWTLAYRSEIESKVTSLCLATRQITPDGKIAYAELTREMLDKCGIESDTEIQNLLLDINNLGTEVFVLFKDIDDQNVRISLRSKRISVVEFAQERNGGGHDLACAMKLPKTDLEEIKHSVIAELQEFIADK